VIINLPKKAYLHVSDNTMTNISKSFTHKMAAKTSWHRYGTKLCHCHPVYTGRTRSTLLRTPSLCRSLRIGPSTGLYRIPKSSKPVLHLFYRCRLQNYISWTEGSRPLQFAVDGVEQVRRLDVKYNTSSAVLPAYSDSYSVLLLDEYLQPEVPCTSVL